MLTPAQVREIDRRAIEEYGIPGVVLMENAGRAAALELLADLAPVRAARVSILCGPGNNGGDGYVVARYLCNAGCDVQLFSTAAPADLRGDAAWAAGVAARMGLVTRSVSETDGPGTASFDACAAQWRASACIVDALLGTGATGEPRGVIARVLACLAQSPLPPVTALDLPTGLDADTGSVAPHCVRASRTLTFVAPKTGFSSAAARAVLGRVSVIDIGVPRALVEAVAREARPSRS